MPDIPTHDMGDLIDQLKNADQIIKKPEKVQEEFNLSKENLEEAVAEGLKLQIPLL